jgi:hypothetical protein
LSTNQADATAIDKYYDEVVADLGRTEWLVTASLVTATAGTNEYTPPATAIDLLHLFYDDRLLYESKLRAIESVNTHWRDERGPPKSYIIEDETNKQFRLYPSPVVSSKDFIFMFGSPLGLDFPEYAICIVHTEQREVLPKWLEMPVAFAILSREFARESDHKDAQFADSCKALAEMLMKMVGP